MKLLKWVFVILFGLSLVGCVSKQPTEETPEEITYKYTYDLSLENYSKYITFRHHHLDRVDADKQLEVFFETKYPNGIMVDVEATVLLQTEVTVLGTTYHSDEFPISFTNLAQASEVLTYSGLKTFLLVAVTEISGKVMTNDETVALAEQASLTAKQGLDTMLEKYNQPYNTLFTESYIHIWESGVNTTSFVKNTFRAEPYYSESIYSDLSGTLMMENSDGDIDVYTLSQYQTNQYIQKQIVIAKEDIEQVVDSTLYELDDSWEYSIENGDFVVRGPSDELFEALFMDEETLHAWQNTVRNQDIEITFADLDTRLLVSVNLWVGLRRIQIETYYTFNVFNPMDPTSYTVLPPTSPVLANQPTGLTQPQKGYMLPNEDYYYQIEVTGGTYVFELSYPVNIEVYDAHDNLVTEEAWYTYNHLLGSLDKKYHLEAGNYWIKMNHNRQYLINYEIKLNHLESLYESIGEASNSDAFVDGYELDVEGKFDEVFVYYDAPNGGHLIITQTNGEDLPFMYADNQALTFNSFTCTIEGRIEIRLVPGRNIIRLLADNSLSISLQVEHYGTSYIEPIELNESFGGYVTNHDVYRPFTYTLTLLEDSTVRFEFMYNTYFELVNNTFTASLLGDNVDQSIVVNSAVYSYEINLLQGEYELQIPPNKTVQVRVLIVPKTT